MAGPAEPVPAPMLGPIQTSKVFDEIYLQFPAADFAFTDGIQT